MKLVLTPRIKEEIEDLDQSIQDKIFQRNWISHSDLVKVYKQNGKSDDDLLSILKNSLVYIEPAPEVQEKSPEFKKSLEILKLKLEEQEYQDLIASSSIPTYDSLAESPARAAKELKHQLTTIVNIIISVSSVAYAIWYWTGTSMSINNAYRVLLCLFFSILVLVAEVVVFNGYLTKIDEAKTRERKKDEIKKVVESVTFNSKKNKRS